MFEILKKLRYTLTVSLKNRVEQWVVLDTAKDRMKTLASTQSDARVTVAKRRRRYDMTW